MIFHDVRLYDRQGLWNIQVRNGKIIHVYEGNVHAPEEKSHAELEGALALPGFINAHDHLDFNLFPQLGKGLYQNYCEWGPRIQVENKDLVSQVQQVPHETRVQWGLYKNLLNGFTAVANHGPRLKIAQPLIHVFQEFQSLHSPGFEKNWKLKILNPFKAGKPVIIHAGEGTDKTASAELDALSRCNYLKRKIIIIHGVAMNARQAASFSGLAWCPASNFFLFGKTADIKTLKEKIKIAFGTDSTLTAPWNAWEHFRTALDTGMASEAELLAMLGMNAAGIFGLTGMGKIMPGYLADIIFLKKDKPLFEHNPADIQLVVKEGAILVADETLNSGLILSKYSKINYGDTIKYVYGDLNSLVSRIRQFFPAAIFPFTIN